MKLIPLLLVMCTAPAAVFASSPAVVKSEFIYETAPHPQCHASTIVETARGELLAAWFGGTREKHPDVGIWVARNESGRWTEPKEVANGIQTDGTRHPTWNPVLFEPRGGPLLLFYKVGPTPQTWWGMVRSSTDGGRSWSEPRRLPEGILGPIKNKPVQLPDGTLLSPTSNETNEQPSRWTVHFERSTDGGKTWTATAPLNDGLEIGAIQPSILLHGRDKLQAVGRTRQGLVFTVESNDAGRTWGPLSLLEGVPNPSSGTDALTLKDGRHLLIYNPVPRGRTPLVISVSRNGREWTQSLVLEDQPGEYSYPAIIQAADGKVHATYTWKRERVKHVVIDPSKLR